VCTHAHSDHYGLAAEVVAAAECDFWMHPRHEHMTRAAAAPERALERRIEVAQQSGVPLEPLRRWASERRRHSYGIAGIVLPDCELVNGVEVDTELGPWIVRETPGHAPSHIALFQPEQRLLLSGDHLLGRVSLYFDYGWTPDPVAEFLDSLDEIERLRARLCLSGHGRPFADVQAHIEANRREIGDRLERAMGGLRDGPVTAFELLPQLFGSGLDEMMTSWALTMALCFLGHLEQRERVERLPPPAEGEPERWTARAR
jgi:glyoxylase-like metal-dependent hydrolase (beta-lactamase superfamily II)